MPETTGNRLIEGQWSRGGLAFPLLLCERTITELAPFDPRSGDPLDVSA